MAVLDERAREIAVITILCPNATLPSGRRACIRRPIRLERAIRDLYGIEPVGLPDTRPWLDLGFWDVQHPLGQRRAAPAKRAPYAFLPTEGENLHQIPVGPVHAGIIEPGHFRFTANGETVVRLEQRLGYVHKGIEALMAGATVDQAARLGRSHLGRQHGRLCALPLRTLWKQRCEVEVPPRAIHLRALMAELERLANHFGDIGAICNDASFSHHARTVRHPARADPAGGRCMLRPSADDGCRACPAASRAISTADGIARVDGPVAGHPPATFPALIELYDNTASLQDRTVSTGILRAAAGAAVRRRRLCRTCERTRLRRPQDCPDTAPVRSARLQHSCAWKLAMSTPASGCASARSSKASG